MIKTLKFAVACVACLAAAAGAQAGHAEIGWTGLTGTLDFNVNAKFGVKGVEDPISRPGARTHSAAWTGADGQLYFFGGYSYKGPTGLRNDLWRRNPATNQWTWLTGSSLVNQAGVYGTLGSPDPANTPGGREGAVYWTGHDGKMYLFGGDGYDGLGSNWYLNDLWRYDPATNQWTWLKGPNTGENAGVYGTPGVADDANTPGGRGFSAAWTGHDGNLYLFGGADTIAGSPLYGCYSDLWRYNPVSNQWTWLKGPNTIDQFGVYGTKGVPNDANVPGARHLTAYWTGDDGCLYLFGGNNAPRWPDSRYNDLWKYNPATNQWTWIHGTSFTGQDPIYGAEGVPGPDVCPGGLDGAYCWTAPDGRMYLFGGQNFQDIGIYTILNDLWRYDPTLNQWAWLKGARDENDDGEYGVRGIPDSDNTPGARHWGSAWTGADGDLYLMGGDAIDDEGWNGFMSDLWRYHPPTNQWTWLAGGNLLEQKGELWVFDPDDPPITPGGRDGMAAWTGSGGELFLFGGDGIDAWGDSKLLNDLWKYDPAARQWTWLAGDWRGDHVGVYGTQGVASPANMPGARAGAVSWTGPDGSLYLFGGYGWDAYGTEGGLNDLWKYGPSSNQWTWLKGANVANQSGLYGTRGVAGDANTPGARTDASAFAANDGKLCLFGGQAYDGPGGFRNDLWSYNPTANQWMWLNGSDAVNQSGVYGDLGTPADANTPGARLLAASWSAGDGHLYLFGGWQYALEFELVSDLWRYNLSTDQWVWIAGPNVPNQPGVYGTRGVADAANTPGSRMNPAFGLDAHGALCLFGGEGRDSTPEGDPGGMGYLNDFWKFDPGSGQWTWLLGSDVANQSGDCLSRGQVDPSNIPGARSGAAFWTGPAGALFLFGGYGYDCGGYMTDLGDLWRFGPPVASRARHWQQY